jgi:Zn-dependent protease with chaperone function
MNFFEQQELARKRTRVMLLLYLLAVVAVVAAVDMVIAVAWIWAHFGAVATAPSSPGYAGALRSVPPGVYVLGALATLIVVLGASLAQTLKLGGGGAAVAEMVGARRIGPRSGDLLERRLLNVVEEMAIASGVRVPAVFVMDEERAINAFAAGDTISNAAVVVTRGLLESLNRDELQGVIGHEFSHILNGDMALNIRMLGILAGIVFISSVGSFILRSVRGGSNKGGGGIGIVGLALFIIGYVGLFFARLIKAAVSRQREYLADASSVQFTRNPDGIAGALDQIGASGRGTLVGSRYAEEMAHMFFGQGIRVWLGGLFDTHPPIEERIRRVNPRFQRASYRDRRALPDANGDAESPSIEPATSFAAVPAEGARVGARAEDLSVAWGRSANESVALVGKLDAAEVAQSRRWLSAMPNELRASLAEPETACATLLSLLLASREEVRTAQLEAMKSAGATRLVSLAESAGAELRPLGAALRFGVVDLALPAVKSADQALRAELLSAIEAAINADRRASLHEFVMYTLVRAQLADRGRHKPPKYSGLPQVRGEVLLLVALCARAGGHGGSQPELGGAAAFRAGVLALGFAEQPMPAADALTLGGVRAALEKLRDLAPLPKAVLIKGLFATVTSDGVIRVIEAELLRMVAAVLDCPLPSLLREADPEKLAP